jgi:DNA-binding CsgD family transcriptional regulator
MDHSDPHWKDAGLENVVGFAPLKNLELNCLRRCADGKTDTDIGTEYGLATSEVASLLAIVRMKLKCPNRLSVIARAARLGLLAV